MMWLDGTPRGLVRAHLRMLPRLEAEEALEMSARVAVGAGSLKAQGVRDAVQRWRRAARGDQPPERLAPAAMGAYHIGYHRVVKRTDQPTIQ